ncbi:hypothetical protein MNEG_12435, partial [Monoraphidium neglectum]
MLRLKQLAALQQLGDRYSPAEAVRPPLWGAPADDGPHPAAVQERTREQLGRLRDSLAPPPRAAGQGALGPPPAPATASQHAPEYRPHWFDPSPDRPSPAARAQDQEECRAQAAAAPPAPAWQVDGDDCADALRPWDPGRSAWKQAWREAHAKGRSRAHRVFEWQLLHAALPCGGER